MPGHIDPQTPHRHMPVLRRIVILGSIVLATLVTAAWTLYIRVDSEYPPVQGLRPRILRFDAYEFGVVFQELAIPLALIALYSGTDGFRRIVSKESTAKDKLRLYGVLMAAQAVVVGYTYFADEMATFGVLVVVAAGLMGGWHMGLIMGLVTMVFTGAKEFFAWPEDAFVARYEAQGLAGVLHPLVLADQFFSRCFGDLGAASAVWAGLVSGLTADLLGERRFAPLADLILGAAMCVGMISFAAISWDNPLALTGFLIPGGVAAGLAATAFGLLVNRVQSGIAQRSAAAAELARAQAEVRALRAQINPHFLFNALNTIRYFVRTDPPAARRLLLDLSAIFQHALRSGDFVPLQKEIEYVKAYLTLEQTRLEDRLEVEWDVEADSQLEQPVPTLILQPIVENAVIHGIAKRPGGGKVSITIRRVTDELVLQVEDDGPGIAPERLAEVLGPGESKSVGLRNVDGRLRALYGDAHGLQVESESGHGTLVRLRIPIEEQGYAHPHRG